MVFSCLKPRKLLLGESLTFSNSCAQRGPGKAYARLNETGKAGSAGQVLSRLMGKAAIICAGIHGDDNQHIKI